MTDHPFWPRHDDANSLNTLLDALVTGKRAPETGSASDPDAFVAVHRLVSGDAAADVSATPSQHTLDSIWRNVMQAHAVSPGTGQEFAPPQSARQKARLNAVADGPGPSRFQTLLSVSAVAAMLIVLIATAWMGRGDGGGSEPSGTERYAAVPLEPGTPEPAVATTPEAWISPIHWEECTAEPMSSGEYVDIIQGDVDLSGRSYEMVGAPAPDTTNEAISSLRTWSACAFAPYGILDPNQARSLSTDAYLSSTASSLNMERVQKIREADPAFAELRSHFESLPFSAYYVVIGEFQYEASTPVPEVVMREIEARNAIPFISQAYNPDLAVELADGRVAIPASHLFRTEDVPQDYYLVSVYIMAKEGDEWLLDEEMMFCVGECEPPATPEASPAATPEGFTPDVQLAAQVPISLRAEPSTRSDILIDVQPETHLMTLGLRERGAKPDADGLPPDSMWVIVRTPGGLTGWVRDIGLEPFAGTAFMALPYDG